MSFDLLKASENNQKLRVLDPDLILLASEAAIDIDNLLLGKHPDLMIIRRLAEQLKNSFDVGATGGSSRSMMDPATLTILSEAVADATNKSLQKVEELLNEAAKIAKTLSSDNPIENREELCQARDFCVALSKAVMAYHKSIYDLSPSHPFRG
ncbi:MAG: hypothetical protein HZC52_07380 [Planctomycetes bacterium]|nr:hypothetical protein [Planctomycetota bacterium]